VFNRQGEMAASAQALVTGGIPGPTGADGGVESTFEVIAAGVRDVARYRVAFKSNERIVAHVDRRDHGMTAKLP
jgi:hypothetical protein